MIFPNIKLFYLLILLTVMDWFPKKYDHSFEPEMYNTWLEEWSFKPESQKWTKWECMIAMPPPNVTGVLHLWHALMLSVQDTMVRMARMKNKRTVWVPWTDHAWIATQVVVERQLMETDKKTKDELGRPLFMKKLWDWVHFSKNTIVSQTKRMWSSCDWSREQFTMSESLSRSVRKAFVKLYNEEKIYRDAYMVNRSPKAKTVLSDLEVEHKEVEGKMYYIKYFVDGKWDCITIATVRPETMFADVAIAVHPKDKRYKKRIWRNILIPIINKSIPIIADEEVDINMWTWALKITPTHSETDYHIAWRHNLPMDNFALDKQGNFTELAWEMLAGQPADEFEENLIHHLKEIWNLDRVEDHTHSVPYCERTWCRVQPFLSTQWFMNVKPAAEKIIKWLEDDDVNIHPDRFKHTFMQRMEDIKPWCLSRQLRWWHRIPIWYNESWKKYAFEEDSVLESTKWKKSILSRIIFNLIADSRLANPFNLEQLIEVLLSPSLVNQHASVWHSYLDMYNIKFAWKKMSIKEIEEIQLLLDGVLGEFKQKKRMNDKIIGWAEKLVDILDKSANIQVTWDTYTFLFLPESPDEVLTQDPDVLDTWFSSWLRPFSVLWRPEKTKDMDKFYPNTIMETGYDIIFFRVIRMMIMWVEHTDSLPFKDIYLHGMVRDKYGKKMSKSKGNVIDPMELIETYWADALRGSVLVGNTPGSDMKFDEQRVEYMWKFINKLRNASRFVIHQQWGKVKKLDYEKLGASLHKNSKKMNAYDRRIFSKTQDLIRQVDRYQEKFMIGESLQEIISIVWHDFCDWYIEISKVEKSDVTEKVLFYCLGTFYKLLHPSLPFVTEKLWNLIWFQWSLMMTRWPDDFEIKDKDYRMNLVMDMISSWRNLKRKVTNKPHEKVDIFVQANKDIQDLVQDHFSLVQDIVKVQNISYLTAWQEIEWDWEIAMIMDIKVWLKGVKGINKKELLSQLETELAQEQQFLQNLRSLFTADFASKAPANVVKDKKAKMEEMKSKVSNIEGEIRRLRMDVK